MAKSPWDPQRPPAILRCVSGKPRAGDGGSGGDHRPPLTGLVVTLAAIAALAALLLSVDPLRDGIGDAISADTEKLREDLRGLGVAGALIVSRSRSHTPSSGTRPRSSTPRSGSSTSSGSRSRW